MFIHPRIYSISYTHTYHRTHPFIHRTSQLFYFPFSSLGLLLSLSFCSRLALQTPYSYTPFNLSNAYCYLSCIIPLDGLHYDVSPFSFVRSLRRSLPPCIIYALVCFSFTHCCLFFLGGNTSVLSRHWWMQRTSGERTPDWQSTGIWDLRLGVYNSQEAGMDLFIPGTTLRSRY
jgi:hypothetical protein